MTVAVASCRRRHTWPSGPRLSVGPKREVESSGCLLEGVPGRIHDATIRFQLARYGQAVRSVLICGACFRLLPAPPPPDPLTAL